MNVLEEVLKEILPKKEEEERIWEVAKKSLSIISSICKNYEIKIEPLLVGSLTRNTWLREKKEFDIFLLFDKKVSREELEKIGLEIGEKFCKEVKGTAIVEYAEHPYTRCVLNELKIDVVPCFKVDSPSELKSSVDRTPFHVEYLSKKINEKNCNEVRLLKKFLENNGLYGADSKVQGFSGFLCELLIIYYGSFIELLKNSSKWKFQTVIDIEKYYENEEEVRKKFKNDPLIVIDPVDKNRNCAAAVSLENFLYFIKLSKKFLENPSKSFFFEKPRFKKSIKEIINERGTKIFLIKFERPKVVDDILFSQLRKFGRRLKNILEEKKYEFEVIGFEAGADEKNCYCLLEMQIYELPKIQKKIGPIISDEVDSKNFLEKYKDAISIKVEDNKYVAIIKRDFYSAKNKIIDSLNESEEILIAKGIPSYIAKSLARGFEIIEDLEIEEFLKNEEVNRIFYNYFEKSLI